MPGIKVRNLGSHLRRWREDYQHKERADWAVCLFDAGMDDIVDSPAQLEAALQAAEDTDEWTLPAPFESVGKFLASARNGLVSTETDVAYNELLARSLIDEMQRRLGVPVLDPLADTL